MPTGKETGSSCRTSINLGLVVSPDLCWPADPLCYTCTPDMVSSTHAPGKIRSLMGHLETMPPGHMTPRPQPDLLCRSANRLGVALL